MAEDIWAVEEVDEGEAIFLLSHAFDVECWDTHVPYVQAVLSNVVIVKLIILMLYAHLDRVEPSVMH